MPDNRLSQIEKNLEILREQQAALEQEALTYTGLPKIRAEQQIRDEIKPKIQAYLQEHQQILTAASEQLQISEPDAEVVIGEIVAGVSQIEAQPNATVSTEMLQLLREIRDKLNEPDKSAAIRVKGMISTFPPFVGVFVEPELDLENFWQRHFPTATRLLKSVVKK